MDPITGAVIAIVLWLVSIGVGYFVAFLAATLVGLAVGDENGGFIGAAIGWIIGAGWAIFALIQAILQIVHLIQLITG